MIGAKLADRLGASIVIENRPGAGAVIGLQALARSPPDGYTLVLSGSTLAVAPRSTRSRRSTPTRTFAPVALVAHYPFLLVATASLPVNSVPELIRWRRRSPASCIYASPGVATSQHLFTELFKVQTGIDLGTFPITAPRRPWSISSPAACR